MGKLPANFSKIQHRKNAKNASIVGNTKTTRETGLQSPCLRRLASHQRPQTTDQHELARPAHLMALQNNDSKLSSSTIVPHRTVVADFKRGEDERGLIL